MVGIRGDDKVAKTQIKVNADESECKSSPAGHFVKAGDVDVCLYLYQEDMKPTENVEVEDITPKGEAIVRNTDTGEKSKVEI